MKVRRAFRDARGGTLVEFALTSTLFFTIAFGIMEFGRLMLNYNIVSNAAREGVRYASVRGSSSGRAASANDVATFVVDRSMGLLSTSNVAVSWSVDNSPVSVIQVRVQYSFTPVVTLLPQTAVNLGSTTQAYILR